MKDTPEKPKSAKWLSNDAIIGAIIILFSLSIFAHVPGSSGDVMLFPAIVGAVSLASGAIILAASLFGSGRREFESFKPEWIALGVSAFMMAAMFAAGLLGFYLCLLLVCFAVNRIIAMCCGERGIASVARSLGWAVAMCGAVYVIFGLILGIVTPNGMFI